MMFMAVSKINNPKSENNGFWTVVVSRGWGKQMETVFISKSKKECVEFAKAHSDKQHITNGVDYGAKW